VVLASIITQSRGVYLTMLLTMVAMTLSRSIRWPATTRLTRWQISWMISCCCLLLLLFVGARASEDTLPNVIVDVGSSTSVRNVAARASAISAAWTLFLKSPWVGIGHGTRAELFDRTVSVHNHFVEQLEATGLLGAIPYGFFHALVLAKALHLTGARDQRRRKLAILLAIAMAATYMEYQVFPGYFVGLFAMICGLLVCLEEQIRRQRRAETEELDRIREGQ
jgi:O-antigen ligase